MLTAQTFINQKVSFENNICVGLVRLVIVSTAESNLSICNGKRVSEITYTWGQICTYPLCLNLHKLGLRIDGQSAQIYQRLYIINNSNCFLICYFLSIIGPSDDKRARRTEKQCWFSPVSVDTLLPPESQSTKEQNRRPYNNVYIM